MSIESAYKEYAQVASGHYSRLRPVSPSDEIFMKFLPGHSVPPTDLSNLSTLAMSQWLEKNLGDVPAVAELFPGAALVTGPLLKTKLEHLTLVDVPGVWMKTVEASVRELGLGSKIKQVELEVRRNMRPDLLREAVAGKPVFLIQTNLHAERAFEANIRGNPRLEEILKLVAPATNSVWIMNVLGQKDEMQVNAAAAKVGWAVNRFEQTGTERTDFFVASLVLR